MEAVECCGASHTTPFCPICGKLLNKYACPLLSLLVYLRAQAGRRRKDVVMQTHAVSQANAEKWEAWRDAVEEIVQAPSSS